MSVVMRGLRPLKLPAVIVLVSAAGFVECTGDDTTACDACVDVTPTPLAVAVKPAEIWVRPGDAPTLTVSLTRGLGGSGDVAVTLESDAGFTADPLTIAANTSQGTLTLHIPTSVGQGDVTLVLDATTTTLDVQAQVLVHIAGAPGTLDTSFGKGGIADLTPTTGNDTGSALLVLQNDMFVGGTHTETADASVVSTMKVLRLTNGGAVDTGFALTTAPGELASLAMLADGRIYAVGDLRTTKADFAAVRILAVGGLDPTYAVLTSLTTMDDVATAGVVQPGGALVAAGTAGSAAFALTRYTQSPPVIDAGSDATLDASLDASDANVDADASVVEASAVTSVLDPTFGDGGVVLTSFGQPNAGATALLVAPDGSLFAVGLARGSTTDIVAARYSANGATDSTFADGGASLTLMGNASTTAAALLDPSGNVVMSTGNVVLRLLPTGALDTSFGTAGQATLVTTSASTIRALARDPATGDLLAAGSVALSTPDCFVARLAPSGAPTTSFVTNAPSTCDVAAIGIDDSGKIVVLETLTSTTGQKHMVVARYWP
jgi:uncharacterized delta-60 repeat protein